MSTNIMPPPWFSAANMALENRIERICDFGGSLPPRNPSTRIVAPGPAISFSTFSISSGSSGSASICSFEQHVAESIAVRIGRGGRRVAADRHALVDFSIGSVTSRRLSPAADADVRDDVRSRSRGTPRRARSGQAPGPSRWPRPGRRRTRPAPATRRVRSFRACELHRRASGITAPLGSLTMTRSVPVCGRCAHALADG